MSRVAIYVAWMGWKTILCTWKYFFFATKKSPTWINSYDSAYGTYIPNETFSKEVCQKHWLSYDLDYFNNMYRVIFQRSRIVASFHCGTQIKASIPFARWHAEPYMTLEHQCAHLVDIELAAVIFVVLAEEVHDLQAPNQVWRRHEYSIWLERVHLYYSRLGINM